MLSLREGIVPLSPVILKERIEKLYAIQRIRLQRERFRDRIFLVGGAIRELALGREPKDYDFALETSADLPALEGLFRAGSFLLGKKPIQTHRIVSDEIAIDVTILEGAIEQDLLRRDFTVNAMAYDIVGGCLLDPLGGLEDVEKRIIRYPRSESLADDPLRMVKAIRHLATLNGFRLGRQLRSAIKENRRLIHRTAAERIKYELDLIMLSARPHKGLKVMVDTGLLFEIIPEFLPMRAMDKEKGFQLQTFGHTLAGFKYLSRARHLYAFTEKEQRQTGYAFLFHDLGKPYTFSYDEETERVHFFHHERRSREIAEPIMERLRFGSAESKAVLSLIDSHMRLFLISHGEATEKATRRLVYKLGELSPSLVFLTILDLYGTTGGLRNESTSKVTERCREVLKAFVEFKREPLPRIITGRELLTLGYAEGPGLGRVLQEIRDKQIAGEIGDKEEALRYAEDSLSLGR